MIPSVASFNLPGNMGKLNINKMGIKVADPFKDTRALKYAF